jgi:precorrin-4/cobalt-precorrin-4 C11-methyltransferase
VISFVGAGPGAADLITLRGARRLAEAEIVVWASSLVPASILEHCQADPTVHDSSSMTLEDVLAVYAEAGDRCRIVRLHSGDPSIWGAIAEQIDWCREHGRSWEVVPGVSSLAGAAAALGRELTQPGVSQSVVLTRLAGRTASSMPPSEGVAAFASHQATMAVFLSAAHPDQLAAELKADGAGYPDDTPAAIVIRATWPDERVIRTTVGNLAEDLRSTGTTLTVLVLVGEALRDAPVAQRSQLYHPSFTTTYRLRSSPGSTRGRPSARRP